MTPMIWSDRDTADAGQKLRHAYRTRSGGEPLDVYGIAGADGHGNVWKLFTRFSRKSGQRDSYRCYQYFHAHQATAGRRGKHAKLFSQWGL